MHSSFHPSIDGYLSSTPVSKALVGITPSGNLCSSRGGVF